jgi:hypothetical protein
MVCDASRLRLIQRNPPQRSAQTLFRTSAKFLDFRQLKSALPPIAAMIVRRSGTTRCAMYGRRPRCKRNLTFCEAFGCSHVSGL